MQQRDPAHPGRVLHSLYLQGTGMSRSAISITELALRLGVSRKTLSLLINEHQGMSAQMAVKLEKVFPATPARQWLLMQLEYDLYRAKQSHQSSN